MFKNKNTEIACFVISTLFTLLVFARYEKGRDERNLAEIKVNSSLLSSSGFDDKFYADLEKKAELAELDYEQSEAQMVALESKAEFFTIGSR